ncbi:hypothetical protein FGE12_24195 [Aggregicoccus sp. 17bor-14]|nr:hypothetical protein [Aggregicoccus sp. 17bor-14]
MATSFLRVAKLFPASRQVRPGGGRRPAASASIPAPPATTRRVATTTISTACMGASPGKARAEPCPGVRAHCSPARCSRRA